MANYTKSTDFLIKDSLPSGDSDKIVKGAEFDEEFNNIASAIADKADTAGPTFTGTATFATANTTMLQISGVAVTSTAAELNILDGVTSTTAEINKLDGFTGTFEDLNYAKDLRASGVTAAEFDILDGLTADATELNILDGATVTTAELNLLDGVTATTAELNILDGVTADATELNLLDGVTATTAELNLLAGVTATTAELNYIDGVTSAIQTQLDAKAPTASPTLTGTVTAADLIITDRQVATDDASGINIDGNDVTIRGGASTGTGAGGSVLFQASPAGVAGNLVNTFSTVMTLDESGIDVAGAVEFDSLSGTGSVSITDILDEDDMTSDSATALATQQSIKAYVDNTVAATNEVVEDTTPQLGGDLDTNGNDITFGDNDKAVFGAGSDLQIYHDGTESFIADTGTGSLTISGGGAINLKSPASENMIVATGNGSVDLYYDNSRKLRTASTGIDVTGTVTADGLTVDGNATINSASPILYLTESDTTDLNTRIRNAAGNYQIHTGNDALNSFTARMNISHSTGDISFYEDTGTTAKFFWDASAERLGIGNSSPATALDVTGTVTADGLTIDSGGTLRLDASSTTDFFTIAQGGTQAVLTADSPDGAANMLFKTASAGVDTSRMLIAAGGDVSLYEDTGTTAKFFWDASAESLGIGTTSPASQLHVSTSSTGSVELARFRNEGQTNNTGFFFTTDETTKVSEIDASGSTGGNVLALATSGTERMRIDSSGNVGVGLTSNTSSDSKFQVKGSGITVSDNVTALASKNSRYFGLSQADQEVTMMYLSGTSSNNTIAIGGGTSLAEPASVVKFHTGTIGTRGPGSERVRIDSSGNVLVAKTSSSLATVGSQLQASGLIRSTVDGADALQLNRKTSDGAIANFYKDGTGVGSIGTKDGDIYIGTNDTTLRFIDFSDKIYPANSLGNARDAAIDLGNSNARFKDLYLSGGAYLGGTAAANKLDDYEEGTWTPTITGVNGFTVGASPSYSATYTKIGRLVYFTVLLDFDSTDTVDAGDRVLISNLPFTRNSAIETITGVGTAVVYNSYGTNVLAQGIVGLDNSTVISVVITNVSGSPTHASLTRISGTYIAA